MLVSQVFGFSLSLLISIVAGEALPKPGAMFWALVGGSSGIVGLACFYAALSRGTMGLVAPLTALIAATIPSIVGLLNGATPGPILLLGMLVALAAVVIISLPDSVPALSVGRPTLAGIRGSRPTEIGLVLIAGLGFAGFFLGVAESHNQGGGVWWPITLVRSAGLVLTGFGIVALRASGRIQDLSVPRATLPLACLAGAGDLGGNLFYLLAVSQTSLPTAVVLSSLYPVQTTILARVVLRERLNGLRLVGVGLAVLGIVLVSVGSMGG